MRRLAALFLALALLSGCRAPAQAGDGKVHILCTTYPLYLFTTAVTQDAPELTVELLVDQQVSCLHDYTLTVEDMKAVDRADLIVQNGGGLEDFLGDALAQKDVPVIDCSLGMDLLPAADHHHDHAEDDDHGHYDPHYWMDPHMAASAMETIALGLDRLLQDRPWTSPGRFQATLSSARQPLDEWILAWDNTLAASELPPLITFHDGFQYFAHTYDLTLLKSIEEEEGSEASARELEEIIGLVEEYRVPAIFVEKNGSRRSADVIARETGCRVYELDLIMSGDGIGLQPYLEAMDQNLRTIREGMT